MMQQLISLAITSSPPFILNILDIMRSVMQGERMLFGAVTGLTLYNSEC